MKKAPPARSADAARTPARSRRPSLAALRQDAATCHACDLWRRGTQTVFGAGPARATLMLVGEQPGDQEDRAGEPFLGPAGRLLRDALTQAGLDPARVYFTNAVKHFKWRPQGKRRIHEKPNREEVLACRQWLDAEIGAVQPAVIVGLGATAAGVLVGPSARVTKDRGRPLPSPLAPRVSITVHPSSILRAPDSAARHEAMQRFVQDLRTFAGWVRDAASPAAARPTSPMPSAGRSGRSRGA